jgi:ribose-phosphate pyrophosphokinase
MIKIDGQEIDIGRFPDGTALIKYSPLPHQKVGYAKLSWYYENDSEFLSLMYLVKHLRSNGVNDIYLYMPYIPNARQDRVKSPEDVFTLKYFAELLNSLNLTRIEVLDPHSTVSEALINNLMVISPRPYIEHVIDKIMPNLRKIHEPNCGLTMFYPDEGAMKRYSGMSDLPYAFGIKKRNWATGQIEGLEVAGAIDQIAGRDILIVDDICSRGGTFLHSAKKLKELGANDIYLFVSHCENTILDGDLLKDDLIKKVFTTHSLFTKEHEKIEVFK